MERSSYKDTNSIDVQNIQRRNGSFDFISINHVLESVPDDLQAFSELCRVLSPEGFMQVTFGGLRNRTQTEIFATPEQEWQAYRRYGSDVLTWLSASEQGVTALAVCDTDICTGADEIVHFFFKKPDDAIRVKRWITQWSQSASFEDL